MRSPAQLAKLHADLRTRTFDTVGAKIAEFVAKMTAPQPEPRDVQTPKPE